MRTNEFSTVLTVGSPTPFGTFPSSGASLILDGHTVAMLVNQLPRKEHRSDRLIIETGTVEVALLTEGTSGLLAWRWKNGEGKADVFAVDTPFHIGLEHPRHRFLPLSADGRVSMLLVTQDVKGRCVSMRTGAIGHEVSSALIDLCRGQLQDVARPNFELQHRRNVRKMMDQADEPLAVFEMANVHSLVAPA